MSNLMELVMDVSEDTLKEKYLIFLIDRQEYAIELRYISEVIGGVVHITEVPEVPRYIKGIINRRGKIIPLLDVSLRFKKEPRSYNNRTCITVVDIDDVTVGLIVDGVVEVMAITEENIVMPPDTLPEGVDRFICGIGKVGNSVKLIVDCKVLLGDEQLAS